MIQCNRTGGSIIRYCIFFILCACLTIFNPTLATQSAPAQLPDRTALYDPSHPPIDWLRHGTLTSQAHDALDFIAAAAQHGLEPDNYHYSLLMRLKPHLNATTTKQFEILLTDGLLQLVHDLAVGRLDAKQADPDWAIPQKQFDTVSFVHTAIHQNNVRQALESLIPDSPEYQILERALAQYQSYKARGGWPTIPVVPLLRPGDHHPAISIIRQRLAFEYPELVLAPDGAVTHYDPQLVQAITQFQHKYGLKQDGLIGNETRKAMNIPVQMRIKQIQIALERRRWLPDIQAERYLFINLANYTLTAFDHHHPVLTMRVIIGRPSRPTPSFQAKMDHIVFNPYWNVPAKLARRDLLPKQQQDPNYFSQHAIRVFTREHGQKVEISPDDIDWNTIHPQHFPYILRQDPGTHNALGAIKFMFANPWGIYLHDTPHKTLFSEPVRAFSSGCIRLEKPLELARFILPSMTDAQIRQRIDSGENSGISLRQPLPLYAVYFTVWAQGNEVHFSPDIYQRDARIAKQYAMFYNAHM